MPAPYRPVGLHEACRAAYRPAGKGRVRMTAGTFDPFDLPSSFDPLGDDSLEPTGQSAYSRHGPPPARQRRVGGAAEPNRGEGPAIEAGAGGRLAHLLQPPRPPGEDGTARLAALEAQVAALTTRLGALEGKSEHPRTAP